METSVKRSGNPNGHLTGEVVVFTGALEISRQKAADTADPAGCRVATDATKNTTLLVVGDVDIQKLSGHKKTSKHRKAEKLLEDGIPIRIISETDFRKLVCP